MSHSRILNQCRHSRLPRVVSEEAGVALLISLIALTIFSALGFYMALNSVTEVRISDNYESHVQAREAALAGIAHARELIRGTNLGDLLKGPDGTYNSAASYLSAARTYAFRNPLSWDMGRGISIFNPGSALAGIPDDGVMSTGKAGTVNGTVLIPLTGIVQTAPNPYGEGTIVTSRYFVKVSDNNGEATELAGDASNNPFVDGDNIIIVRSMGIARTVSEHNAASARSNSVVVYEARFRRTTTWNLNSPFVVEGDTVLPSAPNMFDGNAFNIVGGNNHYGIGTIDTNPGSGTSLPDQLRANLSRNQENNITGMGANPSLADITGSLTTPDQILLMDPNFLYMFATSIIPAAADACYYGDQSWSGGGAVDMGYYNPRLPANDLSQRPRIIYVDGDLNISGNCEGGGILVVRGKLNGSGTFTYNGLILVLGQGEVDMSGWNIGLEGGMFIANFTESGGVSTFGTPKITFSGNSNININATTIGLGVDLLPAIQLSLREVTSTIDP